MAEKYNARYPQLLEKITFTEKSSTRIQLGSFGHHNQEAGFIAWKINQIGPSYDTLILVPTVHYSVPIRLALRKRFINFSCEFDIEDTELYLMYVLLRWLKEPSDNLNLRILIEEIINKGISDIPSEQAEVVGTDESKSTRDNALREMSNLWKEIAKGSTLYTKLKSLEKRNKVFAKLLNVLSELRKSYLGKDGRQFIWEIVEKLRLWQDKSSFSKEINAIVAEMKSTSMSSGDSSVRILTMKKAKGLAADYVFIVGVEKGVLPWDGHGKSQKEEDSRVFYVSMTRARKEVYILHSQARDRNITKLPFPRTERSEFIDAIPKVYVQELKW